MAGTQETITALVIVDACEACIAVFREVARDARDAAAKLSNEPIAKEGLGEIARAADESEKSWTTLRDKWLSRAKGDRRG